MEEYMKDFQPAVDGVILEPAYIINYSAPLEEPLIDREVLYKQLKLIWFRTAIIMGYLPPNPIFQDVAQNNDENEVFVEIRGEEVYRGNFYPELRFVPAFVNEEKNPEADREGKKEIYFDNKEDWGGTWVEPELASELDNLVMKPHSVLASHIKHINWKYADRLLFRDTMHRMVEVLAERQPRLVEDIFPERIKPHQLHQVLKNLLADHYPVKPLDWIFETLDEEIDNCKDMDALTARCKERLDRLSSTERTKNEPIISLPESDASV